MKTLFSTRFTPMRFVLLASFVVSSFALAQPALGSGSCAISTNQAQPFVGETFTANLALRNTGTASGFVPAAEVFVPTGLTLSSATAFGTAMTVACQPAAASFTNPLTREVVTGPTGMAYCFIRYPLSSLAPASGAQTATLTFSVAANATIGTALTPQASCLFAFGTDSLLNNSGDPVIRSDLRTSGTDQITSTTVTPAVIRVAKVAPRPTASGPSFSTSWSITVDVANGVTLAGNTGAPARIHVTDTIPSAFQLTSITAPGAVAISAVPVVPGGTVDVEYTTIAGVTGVDRTITLTGFVPQNDASAAVILSQSCAGASTATMTNSAAATNLRISAGAVVANATSTTVSLQARAEVIRETITNVSSPGTNFRPGQTGRVTLDVDVSDYFNLTGVSVASTLGAGVSFDVGSATLEGAAVAPAISGSEPTTLTFTLGSLNGGEAGGTSRAITYTFTVLEAYAATAARVQGGDVIDTTNVLTSSVAPAACGLTSNETQGGSNASVTILAVEQFAKSVFAISRGGLPQPVTVPAAVQPGDIVTWRLRAVLPSGDQAAETFVDYLPLPLFLANEYGAAPAFGSANFFFGPDNTLPASATVAVATSGPTANNSVTFNISGFETLPSAPVTIDLMMRFTVQNTAQEDGLVFTNLATAAVQGSGSTTTSASVVALVQAEEPLLSTTLGITRKNGVANTGAYNGVYNSTTLVSNPETANANLVDGADTIELTMIVENRGKQPAREVTLRHVPVVQLTSCTTPTVQTGGAAPTTIAGTSGDLFVAGGLSLGTNVIAPTNPTSGANLVVIRFTCTLQNTGANAVSANQTLTNTAEIVRYTNVPGGPNFVTSGLGQPTDTATVTTRTFTLVKTLTAPTTPFSRTVQDQASYSISLTIPEGVHPVATLVDTLPVQLATTSATAPVLVLPAGVSCSSANCVGQNVSGVINAAGQTITWTFGTLTNTNTDNALAETTNTAAYSVVVVNHANSNHGRTGVVNALSARLNGTTVASAAAQALNIVEPNVTLAQVVSPTTADAADTVTMTATINNSASRPTAYDLTYTLTLPTGITPPTVVQVTAAGSASITVVGQLITVTYASLAANSNAVISYPMLLNGSIPVGTTVGLLGTVTSSTQPGATAQVGPNTTALERSYTATNTANLTIKPFVITNVRTSAANAVIGDYVTHTISVTVPEGARSNFEITQNLPVGLAFVDATLGSLVISGPVLCNGIACTIPVPTVSNNGRTVVFNFGNVTNTNTDNATNETLSFEVRSAVTNVTGVVAGSVLGSGTPAANVINATAGSGSVVSNDSTPVANKRVTIIEPAVAASAVFSPTVVNAGDAVQITLTFATTGGTSAHDFSSLTTLSNMSVTSVGASTCPVGISNTTTTVTMTAIGALTSGSTCSVIVNAQVGTGVTVGAALSANTTTRWSSLPGAVIVSRSTYYGLAVERTGNTADVGGSANTYTQSITPSINAASAATVGKVFVSTNNANTVDPKLAMGEDVVYRLTVALQEGVNPSVVVTDSPPAGLRLLSVEYEPGTFTGSLGNNPTNLALGGTSGQAFTFNLGNVTLPGDNVTTNDTFSLRITARAVLAAQIVNTTTSQAIAGSNVATMSINGVAQTGGNAIADFVLPLARVSTTTSPGTISANGVETVTGRLANNGTGPLCNTTVTIAVPAGFTPVNPLTDGVDNNGTGGIDDATEATLLVAGQFVVPITGCILPGADVSFPFRATAAANIPPGTAVFTTTLGGYDTLPAAAGQTLNPTSDFMDNNGTGGRDETGDAVGSSSVTVLAPVIVFSKSFVNLDGGVPKPTDLVEYTISVANTGTAQATGVTVSDPLPTAHATIVAGSESISPAGGGRTVSLVGSTLSATIGTLAAAETITVTVRLQLDAIIDNGVTVSNQATLATTDGYGPRVSNDPSTVAANDPTVFTVAAKPRLALNTQPTITSANAAAYTVSGTCSNGSGDGAVTITIGTFTTSTPCVAGVFTSVVDVSGVADSATLSIVASQTNPRGTSTDTKVVIKDTIATVAIIAPAAGITVSPNPTISGTGEIGATVTLKEGATTLCTVTVGLDGLWSCPTTLPIGPHTVVAVAVDALGNISSPATRSFVVDLLPIVVITTPVTINAGNAAAYPVNGTCTVGAGVVTITIGSVTKTTPCDAAGTFSTTLDVSAVPDGATVSIVASQTNTAGTGTDTKSAKKDTTIAVPVIVTPADGTTVAPSPTISGTAEANATVTVREGSTTICTATADNTGAWSCASTLGVGSHTLVATQVDPAGNSSLDSAPDTFTIVALPAVTLDTLSAVNAANVSAYVVHGTCVVGAGSVVVVIGSVSSTVTCDVGGTFSASFNLSSMADVAALTVTATQTNSVGTSTDTKNTVKDTVVTVAITSPGNGTTVAPNPTISGSTEPGATVTVTENGSTVCTATATSTGFWSCASTLGQGTHSVQAIAVDVAGNTSAAANDTFIVAGVPVVVLDVPAVINAGNVASYPVSGTCTVEAMTVTVTVNGVTTTTLCLAGGTFSTTLDLSGVADLTPILVTASQSTPAGTGSDTKPTSKDTAVSPPVISGPANGSTVAPNPVISGSSEPNATVTVSEGNTVVCTATANSAGQWSCASSLGLGSHTVTATQTDVAGNTSSASAPDTFTVDTVPVVVLATPGVVNAANAAAVPVSGTCTTSAGTVTIVVGSVSTTTACTNGQFATTVDLSQEPEGTLIVTASQTNLVGTGSDTQHTRVDTEVAQVVITGPANGSTVAAHPTISGSAEPFAIVTVREGTTVICTAQADSAGHFSCNSALELGEHTVTATQVDAAGNTSAVSAPDTFTIAGVPVVTIAPLPGVTATNAAAYPVSGTCTTGAGEVTVVIGGVTATAPCEMGVFSVLVNISSLADTSTLTVTATQTNPIGTGTATATTSKDTVKPQPPVIVGPVGGSTHTTTPDVTGTSEPGASVDVFIDGVLVGTTTAGSDGGWSFTPPTLGAGPHTVSATAKDAAGNVSTTSTVEFVMLEGGFATGIGARGGGGCNTSGGEAMFGLALGALLLLRRRFTP